MSANELLLVEGIALGIGIAALVFVLARTLRTKRPDLTSSAGPESPTESPQGPAETPRGFGGYVSVVKTVAKTLSHSIQVRNVDSKTEFVVDGVTYRRAEDIPDPRTRAEAERISGSLPTLSPSERDALARALSKEGSLEASDDQIRIEKTGDHLRFIINGAAYDTLDEIPDSALRERVRLLLKSFP